jgi:Ca2+-binding RTX toxin-like protein
LSRVGLLVAALVALAAFGAPEARAQNYKLTVTTTAGGTVTGGSAFNQNSINCLPNSTGDCEDFYPPFTGIDQTVQLTATPSTGWRFTGWTGCTVGSNPNQCSRFMGPSNADRTVTASFANDPPTVQFTDPVPFTTVSGDITLRATAADDSAVTEVKFWQQLTSGTVTFRQLIGTDTTPPYQVPWHTRTLDNGNHVIVAEAVDAAGAEDEDLLDVIVRNANGVRYAAPGGTGPDPCLQANPCDFAHAIQHAVSGDEVIVMPGDYVFPNGILLFRRQINLHGLDGQPRPRLVFTGTVGFFLLEAAATLRHLQIEATMDDAVALGVSTFATPTFSDLVLTATGTDGAALTVNEGNALVRDSILRSTGANGLALDGRSTGTVELRNLTAWSSGPNSIAIRAGCLPGACFGDGPYVTRARNVVARGTRYDLQSTSPDPDKPAILGISHSNFRPGFTNVSIGSVLNDEGNNQSTEPLFVNPAAGDFHQRLGSPTIDAGVADPMNGATDFDGEARPMGPAPDIGADELPYATLTVTKVGTGTVTSTPPGIDCGSDCSQEYPVGTTVALSQAPGSGFGFAGWSDACTGTGPCTVIVDAPKNVGASFAPKSGGPGTGQAPVVGGRRCTIWGNGRANRLTGTARADVICGLGGNDTVRGGGGNDVILLGAGNDTGYGQGGNDRIVGASGRDRLFGGPGRDRLEGGPGRDRLVGGPGRDRCQRGRGDTRLTC